MLDDTCYMLGFDNFAYAKITYSILNSQLVRQFISTISFADAKRVVSTELLMRIDLLKALELLRDTMNIEGITESDIQQYRNYLKCKNQDDSSSLFDDFNVENTSKFFVGQPGKLQNKQKCSSADLNHLQLDFLDLFDQYELEPITQNSMVREDIEAEYGTKRTHRHLPIDLTKNLLICNVKKDNWEQYLDGTAKIYYTGKKFPTTVALNKLYYFMPYLSGKGIRDLYYIKIARLGYRKEGQVNEDKNDLRLVFEIERVGQLFDDYKKVKLEIWRTFTDTTMEKITNL